MSDNQDQEENFQSASEGLKSFAHRTLTVVIGPVVPSSGGVVDDSIH